MMFCDTFMAEKRPDEDLLDGYPTGTFFIRPASNSANSQYFTLVFVNQESTISRYKLLVNEDGFVQLLTGNNNIVHFNFHGVDVAPANFESVSKFLAYAREHGLSSKGSIIKLTDSLVEITSNCRNSFKS